MADKDFVVKNGLVVNTSFSANSSGLYFSNALLANSTSVNATTFTGTANNASYLGGLIASGYQTTAGLSANIATITANNTSFVGSVSAANVVSNAQLSANLSNYQTTAGLTANIASYLPTYTGVVNGSSHTVSSSFIANATGVYHTGTINAASHTVGSGFVANATGVTANSLTVSTNTVTIGSSVYAASNGNIGLGATPGVNKLDVFGNAIIRGLQGFDANSETATLYIGNSDSYIQAIYDGGLDFYQGSNRVARFSAQSSASVGMFQFNSGYGSAANAYGVRAWINFYDNAVRNSGNMAGISKQSTGYFIVYIDTDMPDANYAAVANYSKRNENTGDQNDGQAMCWDYQTSYFRVTVSRGDGGIIEPSYVCSVVIVR